MGDTILVDPALMLDAGGQAARTSLGLAVGLARLIKHVCDSYPQFRSPAGDAFRSFIEDMGVDLRGLVSRLDSLAISVNVAPGVYQATEGDSAAVLVRVVTEHAPETADIIHLLDGIRD